MQRQTLSLLLVDNLERIEGINISDNFHLQFVESQHGSAVRVTNATSYMLNISSAKEGVYVLEVLVGLNQVAAFESVSVAAVFIISRV